MLGRIMSYAGEHVIAALKAGRKKKRLTQRRLSAQARVPQSHISKIESGAVDIKLSSLIELARVLGLEVILAPRKLLPAVQAVLRSGEASTSRPAESAWKTMRELRRIQDIAGRLKSTVKDAAQLRRLQQAAVELGYFPILHRDDRRTIKEIADTLKKLPEGPKALAEIRRATETLQGLRNMIAHRAPEKAETPRPAYSLDEDADA
jgi:transcriptional regulator with XRE-family HTH domain